MQINDGNNCFDRAVALEPGSLNMDLSGIDEVHCSSTRRDIPGSFSGRGSIPEFISLVKGLNHNRLCGSFGPFIKKKTCFKRKGKRRTVLPISQGDLAKTFRQYLGGMLGNIPLNLLGPLIGMLFQVLWDQVGNASSDSFFPFYQSVSNRGITKVSLNLTEAFHNSVVDMMPMSRFMVTLAAIFLLAVPLHFKMLIMTMASLFPIYYFPVVLMKAPHHVSVNCGSFEMPVFWFTVLGALGFSLLLVIVITTLLYLSWKIMIN